MVLASQESQYNFIAIDDIETIVKQEFTDIYLTFSKIRVMISLIQ